VGAFLSGASWSSSGISSYLERGEFSPSLHLALRVCDYFEVVFSLSPFPRLGTEPVPRSA
jgi:putative transcriptional regulator